MKVIRLLGLLLLIPLHGTASPANETVKDDPERIYLFAEKLPVFDGGDMKKFHDWVVNNTVYPELALERGVEGKVVVWFVVEKDGALSDIEVLAAPHRVLGEAVVRAVAQSPEWEPGEDKDGRKIRVRITVPVEFRLPVEAEFDHDENVWLRVETMPSYQGRTTYEFANWVLAHLKTSHRNEVIFHGEISFIVEADGTVSGVEVLRDNNQKYAAEIAEFISATKDWNPGIHEGKPVRVKCDVTFTNRSRSSAAAMRR